MCLNCPRAAASGAASSGSGSVRHFPEDAQTGLDWLSVLIVESTEICQEFWHSGHRH